MDCGARWVAVGFGGGGGGGGCAAVAVAEAAGTGEGDRVPSLGDCRSLADRFGGDFAEEGDRTGIFEIELTSDEDAEGGRGNCGN